MIMLTRPAYMSGSWPISFSGRRESGSAS